MSPKFYMLLALFILKTPETLLHWGGLWGAKLKKQLMAIVFWKLIRCLIWPHPNPAESLWFRLILHVWGVYITLWTVFSYPPKTWISNIRACKQSSHIFSLWTFMHVILEIQSLLIIILVNHSLELEIICN